MGGTVKGGGSGHTSNAENVGFQYNPCGIELYIHAEGFQSLCRGRAECQWRSRYRGGDRAAAAREPVKAPAKGCGKTGASGQLIAVACSWTSTPRARRQWERQYS